MYAPHRMLVEGHRGGKAIEPENTLRSFKRAIDLHCDSVELDVWLSKDKELYVIHGKEDGDISITTNSEGLVSSFTSKELDTFDAGMGERIPRLEEVLKLCKDKLLVNIEIKGCQSEEVVDKVESLITKMDYVNNCCVSSFEHKFLERMRKLNNKIELGYLYDAITPEIIDQILECKGNTVNICIARYTKDLIDRIHAKGMAAMAWVSAAQPKDEWHYYKFALENGIDIFCVNHSDKLIEYISKHK